MIVCRVLFDHRHKSLWRSLFKNPGSSCSAMAEFATEKGEESLEDLVTLLFSQMRTAPEGWTSELSSDVDPAILDIFLPAKEGGVAGSNAPADSGATAVSQTTAARSVLVRGKIQTSRHPAGASGLTVEITALIHRP